MQIYVERVISKNNLNYVCDKYIYNNGQSRMV